MARAHTHLNALEKELSKSKDDYKALQQHYVDIEKANNDRIIQIENEHKKEIESIQKNSHSSDRPKRFM